MFGILEVGILMLVFIVNVMHNQSNLIMTDDTCEFGQCVLWQMCFVNKVKITYSCYNVCFKEFPTEH